MIKLPCSLTIEYGLRKFLGEYIFPSRLEWIETIDGEIIEVMYVISFQIKNVFYFNYNQFHFPKLILLYLNDIIFTIEKDLVLQIIYLHIYFDVMLYIATKLNKWSKYILWNWIIFDE